MKKFCANDKVVPQQQSKVQVGNASTNGFLTYAMAHKFMADVPAVPSESAVSYDTGYLLRVGERKASTAQSFWLDVGPGV